MYPDEEALEDEGKELFVALEAMSRYRKYFQDNNIGKEALPKNWQWPTRRQIMMHCHKLLDKAWDLTIEGEMEKFFKLVGFIEGCLFSEAIYTQEEIENPVTNNT